MIRNPLDDAFSTIELIAHTAVCSDTFSTDDMPVLAARVSHAGSGKTGEDPEGDMKLMNYLAKHKHMTPFEHQTVTFRVVAPLFVFREWHRHRTQSYNEVSMRYSSNPVGQMYLPYDKFREQATRNKQSSAGLLSEDIQKEAEDIMSISYNAALTAYEKLLDIGVCREQARAVVPVGNYSEMYATANLRNWAAFCALRCDEHAQYEIRIYANAINDMLGELWPRSWSALREYLIS